MRLAAGHVLCLSNYHVTFELNYDSGGGYVCVGPASVKDSVQLLHDRHVG